MFQSLTAIWLPRTRIIVRCKEVKTTHFWTDTSIYTHSNQPASQPVSHVCQHGVCFKSLVASRWFSSQGTAALSLASSGWRDPYPELDPTLYSGGQAGGKRKTPEEALIEFLAVRHSSASSLCEIMPCKLSLPAKNSVYQLTEAISNAPSKASALVAAAATA